MSKNTAASAALSSPEILFPFRSLNIFAAAAASANNLMGNHNQLFSDDDDDDDDEELAWVIVHVRPPLLREREANFPYI